MLYLTDGATQMRINKLLTERRSKVVPHVMSDALPANNIKLHDVVDVNCLVHGRRNFYDLKSGKLVVDKIKEVYKAEAHCKENGLTPDERLAYHQQHSKPAMDAIKTWCEEQIENKRVEANSELATPINYLLKHWDGLTNF
jgi:hypothetical protein